MLRACNRCEPARALSLADKSISKVGCGTSKWRQFIETCHTPTFRRLRDQVHRCFAAKVHPTVRRWRDTPIVQIDWHSILWFPRPVDGASGFKSTAPTSRGRDVQSRVELRCKAFAGLSRAARSWSAPSAQPLHASPSFLAPANCRRSRLNVRSGDRGFLGDCSIASIAHHAPGPVPLTKAALRVGIACVA